MEDQVLECYIESGKGIIELESGKSVGVSESGTSIRVLESGEIFWNHVREGRISILALQNWTSIRVLESWASDLELGGGGQVMQC